jgi:hypothetical protein
MQTPIPLFTIKRSRVVAALVITAFALILLHVIGLYIHYELGHPFAKGFVPLFNLDTEGNVPTFFSALLLLIASLLFFWIARHQQLPGAKYSMQWRMLPPIFLLLAIDEAAKIHELLIEPMRAAFHLKGIFFFSWVIVGMAAVAFLAAVYFRFVVDLPPRFRGQLLLATALYLAGVIGLELVGGNYASLHGYANLPYELIATSEELFEITGLIILINALLKQLQAFQARLEIMMDA